MANVAVTVVEGPSEVAEGGMWLFYVQDTDTVRGLEKPWWLDYIKPGTTVCPLCPKPDVTIRQVDVSTLARPSASIWASRLADANALHRSALTAGIRAGLRNVAGLRYLAPVYVPPPRPLASDRWYYDEAGVLAHYRTRIRRW